jgi:hypothetical protein
MKTESPPWDLTELKECLVRFASKVKGESCLAMFVDGLDEYDGDHVEMVQFLKKLKDEYDIKLCVSSRPWTVFSDEFALSPSLRMEDLTKADIAIYIKGRLGNNRAMKELRELEPESIDELTREIGDKAQGVFLWVVLVVEQLLVTARDNPCLPDIWAVFNSLPPSLEELYDTIQSSIEPTQQATASKLYQLLMEWKRTWNGQIEATVLWLALNLNDPVEPVEYPTLKKEAHLPPVMTRILAGHTKGILQLSKSSNQGKPSTWTVDFLHRTTFDWLRMERNWSKICGQQPPGFTALLNIIAVLVGHLKSLDSRQEKMNLLKRHDRRRQCIFRILKLSGEIENTQANRVKLVAILDRLVSERLLTVDQSMFHGTRIPSNDRVLKDSLPVLAAAWSCLPYLEAKCASNPEIMHSKYTSGIVKSFSKKPTPISLIEASVLGGVSRINKSKTDNWFDESRFFTQWQSSRRLDTIKFLLQNHARPDSSTVSLVKELRNGTKNILNIEYEHEYWTLVANLLDFRSTDAMATFDALKDELLPGVNQSRQKEEFPECQIC